MIRPTRIVFAMVVTALLGLIPACSDNPRVQFVPAKPADVSKTEPTAGTPEEKARKAVEAEFKAAVLKQYIGTWQIIDEKGETTFTLTLEKSFKATKSNVPDAVGIWEIAGNEARITWSDGGRDVIRKQPGFVEKITVAAGKNWNDPPASSQHTIKLGDASAGPGPDAAAKLASARERFKKLERLKSDLATFEEVAKNAIEAVPNYKREVDEARNKAVQARRDASYSASRSSGATSDRTAIFEQNQMLRESGKAAQAEKVAKEKADKLIAAEKLVMESTAKLAEIRSAVKAAQLTPEEAALIRTNGPKSDMEKAPSIEGEWEESPEIRLTITQMGKEFTANCTYQFKGFGEVRWRMNGTISADGQFEGQLVQLKAPPDWKGQIRTAILSPDGNTLKGYAAFGGGGGHNFVWKRIHR